MTKINLRERKSMGRRTIYLFHLLYTIKNPQLNSVHFKYNKSDDERVRVRNWFQVSMTCSTDDDEDEDDGFLPQSHKILLFVAENIILKKKFK